MTIDKGLTLLAESTAGVSSIMVCGTPSTEAVHIAGFDCETVVVMDCEGPVWIERITTTSTRFQTTVVRSPDVFLARLGRGSGAPAVLDVIDSTVWDTESRFLGRPGSTPYCNPYFPPCIPPSFGQPGVRCMGSTLRLTNSEATGGDDDMILHSAPGLEATLGSDVHLSASTVRAAPSPFPLGLPDLTLFDGSTLTDDPTAPPRLTVPRQLDENSHFAYVLYPSDAAAGLGFAILSFGLELSPLDAPFLTGTLVAAGPSFTTVPIGPLPDRLPIQSVVSPLAPTS